MDLLISLPGLHRVNRGAEVALEAIATGLARRGHAVTALGSGPPDPTRLYTYRRVRTVARERFSRWPSMPFLREPSSYESLLFNAQVAAGVRLGDFDATISCGFPWDNLVMRRPVWRGRRPPHVFITENGDWPALVDSGDARVFGCDGLVCTNPLYLERNESRWNSTLIPNGVDVDRFSPGASERTRLGLPEDVPVVVMVSALIPSKRVDDGIRAVAAHPTAALVVAGSGPMEEELAGLARDQLGARYIQATFDHSDMPALYRSADALLHLTRIESFGNVYIEAMSTGLPVIAHRSPVTEWIAGDDACLVDSDDAPALASAIAMTLAAGREHGSASREARVRRDFSWTAVVERYDEFLQDLVGS